MTYKHNILQLYLHRLWAHIQSSVKIIPTYKDAEMAGPFVLHSILLYMLHCMNR